MPLDQGAVPTTNPEQSQTGEQTPNPTASEPTGDLFKLPDSVQGMIGEGKKYSDPTKALESLPHKETHIQTLEAELKELREQLAQSKAAEDVLEALKKEVRSEQSNQSPVGQTQQQLSEDQLQALIDQRLTYKEQTSKYQANIDEVGTAFKNKFGEKAKEQLQRVLSVTQMSEEDINTLAAKSPAAAKHLLGLGGNVQTTPASSYSNVNTEAFMRQQSTQQENKPQPMSSFKGTPNAGQALKASWDSCRPV